jgi:hypothetical protein
VDALRAICELYPSKIEGGVEAARCGFEHD